MRHAFTPSQVAMLVHRAEQQLQQIIGSSLKNEPWSDHVPKASHAVLHETVVSLIKLFRDQVPGAAGAATQIAREYAKGVDARSAAPKLACVRAISSLAKGARERYLAPDMKLD